MDNSRFSLMTLNFRRELVRKTMIVEDVLRLAADEQIPCVDILGVQKREVPAYQAAMASTGAKVFCYISTLSLFSGKASLQKALDNSMRVAKDLGAELFMIVPYYPVIDNRKAQKYGRQKTLAQLVSGFALAVEKGKEYGLKVCFETTPQEDVRLSGIEDCRYVLERVSGLGLVFDTANMLPHGDDTLAYYEALKDYIVHVHLKDVALNEAPGSLFPDERAADGRRMRCVPFGEGVIPVREVYQRMLSDGYAGRFAIEYTRPKAGACTAEEHRINLEKHLMALEPSWQRRRGI